MGIAATLRPPALSKKAALFGLLSVVYFGAILYLINPAEVTSVLGRIPAASFLWAGGLVIVSNLFALVRSGTVLGALGFKLSWRDLLVAFAAGNVSNLPLNVVGQGLTRAMVLVRAGIPSGATILATFVERLLAAALLFFFSLVSLWLLFGRVDFDISRGGGDILTTIVGMALVCTVAGMTVFRSRIRDYGRICARWLLRLGPSAILTILCHASALGAYLVLLNALDRYGISLDLIAALTIVMFVTSLPISFAGWGLRELSAAGTLGLIGISPEVSVAAAIAIGLLFLAGTGLFGGLSLVLLAGRRRDATLVRRSGATAATQRGTSIGSDWDARIVQACAILCAIFLMFRVPMQFVNSAIPVNVNVADVVVFLGLSVILLMIAAGRMQTLFRPFLTRALAGFSAVILVGLLVSYGRDNLGSWAVYTRGVGWILMLGYAALGAAMVNLSGNRGRMAIPRLLTVSAMTVCVLQLLLLAWSALMDPLPQYLLAYPLEGFANNQNAFCFELAMIGTLLVVGRALGVFRERDWLFNTALAVLTVTVYFTGSRTGAVFIVLLAMFDHFMCSKWVGDRPAPDSRATLFAAVAIVGAILLPYAAYYIVPVGAGAFGIEIDPNKLFLALAQPDARGNTRLLHITSDLERWETIVGGLRLWADRPILGAGLGAYVEFLLASGAKAQGIHSTYVWFLVEMGIVGFAVAAWSAALVAAGAWRMISRPESAPWGFAMIGILAFMAVGDLAQDFFYQRMFWFLLGLTAAGGAAMRKENSDAGIFLAVVLTLSLFVLLLAL